MRSVYLFTLAIFIACTACAPESERASQQSVRSVVSSPTPQLSPTTVATNTPNSSASTPVPSDGVKRITVAELRNALDRNEAVVIDVRAEAQYNTKHIKGARHIAAGEIAARAAELPRNKTIVTYCS